LAITDKHELLLNKLRNRTTPVFIIILFSFAVSTIRVYLVPQFSLFVHFLLFLGQISVLTGIWYLIRWLNRILDKRLPFDEGPLKRMGIQVALTLLLVAPVFVLIGFLAAPYVPLFVTPQFVGITMALFVVIIFLFNFAFYSFYFFSNWQSSIEEKSQLQIKAAELEKEKFTLQYHQLKNQVNPHYLFNSLSSLDGLIQTNPDLASRFVRHMSKVYRYTLQHKENEVVSLEEESEFIRHYKELLQIRYEKGIVIEEQLSAAAKEKGIVMVTLQMLIDNAVKHNSIQPEKPLRIVIRDEDDYLLVQNNVQLRRQIETSNGQGLAQLVQLYGYLSEKPVMIKNQASFFTVQIPLL
jgi:two-component system, LytTR family, sensor kinase